MVGAIPFTTEPTGRYSRPVSPRGAALSWGAPGGATLRTAAGPAGKAVLVEGPLRERGRDIYGFDSFLGKSPQIQRLLEQVAQVARTGATVLIEGESGTGKELIARAIHGNSARAEGPFIAVNCAALPETLLESELFGHVKGAFTGAASARKGLFEEASGGTLLLDEIGDTPPAMQAKLLRVLQDGEIRRVGSNTPIRVDVRVLAATNKYLDEQVRGGAFREDLFYRLNVVCLRVPALRERREDILDLAHHFLRRSQERLGRPAAGFTAEALDVLQRHAWPGNVRELENAVERAVVLCRCDRIGPEDLPLSVSDLSPGPSAGRGYPGLPLREVEREHILATLQECHGNQVRTAELLGIARNTLWRKVKEYGIKASEQAASGSLILPRPASPALEQPRCVGIRHPWRGATVHGKCL